MKKRIEFKTCAPLMHGAFDAVGGGNASALRRFPVLFKGNIVQVPAVSGNALRGQIRRLLMRDMFQRLGFDHTTPGFDKAYATAANGGVLEGFDAKIDPDYIRDVRAACPPLSVLGAGMGTWFLEGRVSVGIVWPVCDITLRAGLVVVRNEKSVPTLADLESETWHSRLPDREDHNPEKTGGKPMPHGAEVINTGVHLQSEIIFRETTKIERAAFARGLELVQHMGGGSGKGFGRVRQHKNNAKIGNDSYDKWIAAETTRDDVARVLLP